MELPLIILAIMGSFVGISVLFFWTIIFYVLSARGRTRAEADAQYEALNVEQGLPGQTIQTEVRTKFLCRGFYGLMSFIGCGGFVSLHIMF